MSPKQNITNAQLDRLVDGELTVDQQQQLLRRLDEQPGQWRRCALAFVEAQALAQTLGSIAEESTLTDDREVMQSHLVGQSNTPTEVSSGAWPFKPLALAASLVFTFVIGALISSAWRGGNSAVESLPIAAHRHTPVDGQPQLAAAEKNVPRNDVAAAEAWPEVIHSSEVVPTYIADDNGQPQSVLVRLVDEQGLNSLGQDAVAMELPPALPDRIRQQLEQAGYRVERQRRYAPIPIGPGRHRVVPVEDTRIVPVRHDVY